MLFSLFKTLFSQMCTCLNSSFTSCLCSDFSFSGCLPQSHYLTTPTHTSSLSSPFPVFFIFPLHLSLSCHIFHLSYLLFLTLISPSQYPSGKQSPRRAEISLFFFSVCNPALITVSGTLQVLNNI